jgi:hypothetical protein
MGTLIFNGEITLDQAFSQNKDIIYNKVFSEIEKHYLDAAINTVHIINISINENDYTINLPRTKFVSALNNARKFYEKIEDYEKCQVCVDITNKLIEKTSTN